MVSIFVSDPWEFGTACGVGPFCGEIADRREGRLLVRLCIGIEYGGVQYEGVIASARHLDRPEATFGITTDWPANFLFVPRVDMSLLDGKFPTNAFSAIGSMREE